MLHYVQHDKRRRSLPQFGAIIALSALVVKTFLDLFNARLVIWPARNLFFSGTITSPVLSAAVFSVLVLVALLVLHWPSTTMIGQ
jgi:hypothetical protein